MTCFLAGSSSKQSCDKKMSDKEDYTGPVIKQQSFWTEMDMNRKQHLRNQHQLSFVKYN